MKYREEYQIDYIVLILSESPSLRLYMKISTFITYLHIYVMLQIVLKTSFWSFHSPVGSTIQSNS